MKKFSIIILIILLTLTKSLEKTKITDKIKNVVVLCMENHSYDNMLGWLEHPIGDLTGEEFNYLDPNNTSSKKYFA